MLIMFPGQGSHRVGMGQDFYNNYKVSRDVFDQMDETIGIELTKMIFEGPLETLGQTKNVQPAIMTSSYAILSAIIKELGRETLFSRVDYVAGHSLGEYTALCAAGSLTFEEAVKLLSLRGEYMQNACAEAGGMLACLGVKDILALETMLADFPDVYIANDNGAGQVVLSATSTALEHLVDELRKTYRVIKLNVGVPCHCKLMNPAALKMKDALDLVNFQRPIVPLISNVTAGLIYEVSDIKNAMIEQIVARVRWRETLEYCINNGVKYYLEIGSDVLSNIVKRIDKRFVVRSIKSVDDLHALIEEKLFRETIQSARVALSG